MIYLHNSQGVDMSQERLSVRKTREILRLKWEAHLTHEERLGLLVDVECTRRADNRLRRRIRAAHFPLPATLEDLDLRPERGLERRQVLELAQGEWIRRHLNVLVLGPTGAGKTYLACALGRAACRQDFSVRYVRTSRLLQELSPRRRLLSQTLAHPGTLQIAPLRRLVAGPPFPHPDA